MSNNATLERAIFLETQPKVGTAGRLASLISDEAGASIRSLWGGEFSGHGHFNFITDNNSKVVETLRKGGFPDLNEDEVLVVGIPDRKGCAQVTNKIGSAGININFLYTTILDNKPCAVISTDNNSKAMGLFK